MITEAYRLDGRGKLDTGDLAEVAAQIARVSSAFPIETIVVKAIERRARALQLSSSAADLIALSEGELEPLQTLRLGDQEFAELVRRLEEQLGGI